MEHRLSSSLPSYIQDPDLGCIARRLVEFLGVYYLFTYFLAAPPFTRAMGVPVLIYVLRGIATPDVFEYILYIFP